MIKFAGALKITCHKGKRIRDKRNPNDSNNNSKLNHKEDNRTSAGSRKPGLIML